MSWLPHCCRVLQEFSHFLFPVIPSIVAVMRHDASLEGASDASSSDDVPASSQKCDDSKARSSVEKENATGVAKTEEALEVAAGKRLRECGLCYEMVNVEEMESLFTCDHKCCIACIRNYFAVIVMDKTVYDFSCPFCRQPDLSVGGEDTLEFFTHLGNQLQRVLDRPLYDMYTMKLQKWHLKSEPYFKWCSKCPNGFISNPRQQRVQCPNCGFILCFKCDREWDKKHLNMTCEEFAKWKKNTEENEEVWAYLRRVGSVTCPRCNVTFVLAHGGCLHLQCMSCKHEFCLGCKKTFFRKECDNKCKGLGLHAHHPKNCVTYLRDYSPTVLQKLLQNNKVQFSTERDGQGETCDMLLLKRAGDGFKEEPCGLKTQEKYAGFCRRHYTEYLSKLIWDQNIDVSLLEKLAKDA